MLRKKNCNNYAGNITPDSNKLGRLGFVHPDFVVYYTDYFQYLTGLEVCTKVNMVQQIQLNLNRVPLFAH